jgi:hypothetical protein
MGGTKNSCMLPAGTKGGFTAETIARGDHFSDEGQRGFKVAVRSMCEISRAVL